MSIAVDWKLREARSYCHSKGTGPEWVCLELACSVWGVDFVQERFHNTSPGDFESRFSKAGDSETKEGLRGEEATGESLGGALLWLSRNGIGKKQAMQGCGLTEK